MSNAKIRHRRHRRAQRAAALAPISPGEYTGVRDIEWQSVRRPVIQGGRLRSLLALVAMASLGVRL